MGGEERVRSECIAKRRQYAEFVRYSDDNPSWWASDMCIITGLLPELAHEISTCSVLYIIRLRATTQDDTSAPDG